MGLAIPSAFVIYSQTAMQSAEIRPKNAITPLTWGNSVRPARAISRMLSCFCNKLAYTVVASQAMLAPAPVIEVAHATRCCDDSQPRLNVDILSTILTDTSRTLCVERQDEHPRPTAASRPSVMCFERATMERYVTLLSLCAVDIGRTNEKKCCSRVVGCTRAATLSCAAWH